MRFKLKQEKLQTLLEKLLVKDMFIDSIITVKDKKLFSIQKEEHGRAFRFAKFNTVFFDEIDESTESINIDIQRILNIIKNIPADIDLIVETKGNKLSITGNKVNINISYREPESEVLTALPFPIEDGTPIVGESKVRLDTAFTIELDDLKEITSYASALKTEFYKFMIMNGKILVRTGGLHDFSDYIIFEPKGKISNGDDLEVTYTYGISQVAETFDNAVNINTKTASPMWIYEGTKEYVLGVLIPPYVESE